jgi:hypothetical protein
MRVGSCKCISWPSWRRITAVVATVALALNIAFSALCTCSDAPADNAAPVVFPHPDGSHQTGRKHHGKNQHDDDSLLCKCCGTVALNRTNAPPPLPVPVRIVWSSRPLFVVADQVLPKPHRHIIEPPRGPPPGA